MKQKSLTKSILKLLAITAGVIFLLYIALTGYLMNQTPADPHKDHSLGNGLEYIGSSLSGCASFCDSRPIFTYYYATDMDAQALGAYFKKMDPSKTSTQHGGSSTSYGTYSFINLSTSSGNGFSLNIYSDPAAVASSLNLTPSTKKHVVSITDNQFATAKDSL